MSDVQPFDAGRVEEPTADLPRDATSATPSSSRSSRLPRLSDYEIIREIGRGGMGIVYEAEQASLGRRVALKIVPELRINNEKAVQRFEFEARTIARLQHDHIVPIYDVGQSDETHYYTMRLIDGSGLDQVVRSLRLHVEESATHQVSDRRRLLAGAMATSTLRADGTESTIIREAGSTDSTTVPVHGVSRSYYHHIARLGCTIADALDYAHSEGIIHRDIKPSNLMLDSAGKVWLTDFGLAKTEDSELTETGNILGTLRFMAPEQIVGIFDRRTDVYSLGITLYELLGLQPAFRGANQMAVIRKIRDTVPQSLQSIDSGIPADLQTIVEKATDKEPKRRYQTAAALADDLKLFLEGRPIRARRVTWVERLWRWSKRNPAVAASVSGVLLLIVVGLIGTTIAAVNFRALATEQTRLRGVADEATKLAEAEAAENRQNLYYAEMKLAVDAARSPTGLPRLVELLDHWVPTSDDPVDRRDFAWYWLNSIARPARRLLDEHDNETLSFNRDGRLLCRTKLGNQVLINTWPSFDERARARVPGEVQQAILNQPGTHVAIVTDAGEVRIWEWERDERSLLELADSDSPAMSEKSSGASAPARAAAWSSTGELLAVAIDRPGTGEVLLIDATDWSVRRRLLLDDGIRIGRTAYIDFSHDDSTLAVTCKRGYGAQIQLIDVASETLMRRLKPRMHDVYGIDWHPTAGKLGVISSDGQIIILHADGNDAITSTKTETFMQSIGWGPDGASILVSGNGSARTHDSETLELRRIDFAGPDGTVLSAFHPDGRVRLVSNGYTGLFAMDGRNEPLRRLVSRPPNLEQCHCFAEWSPDGRLLATSAEPPMTIWDTVTGEPRLHGTSDFTIEGQPVAWLDENTFASHYRDQLTLWDRDGASKIEDIRKPAAETGGWHVVHSASDGEQILMLRDVGYANYSVGLWNRVSGEIREVTPLAPGRAHWHGALSPDDSKVAVGVGLGLLVFNAKTGENLARHDLNIQVDCGGWSHNGDRLAVGDRRREITIYDGGTLKRMATYRGHTGKVAALAWSPNGMGLASAGFDSTIRLWDTRTGRSTAVIPTTGVVRALRWSPDGQRLAAMSQNGIGLIFDATHAYALEAERAK